MPEGITMIDGLPYLTENTGPGLSAVDGAVPGAEDSGMPMDTGEDSEMLMRQMF